MKITYDDSKIGTTLKVHIDNKDLKNIDIGKYVATHNLYEDNIQNILVDILGGKHGIVCKNKIAPFVEQLNKLEKSAMKESLVDECKTKTTNNKNIVYENVQEKPWQAIRNLGKFLFYSFFEIKNVSNNNDNNIMFHINIHQLGYDVKIRQHDCKIGIASKASLKEAVYEAVNVFENSFIIPVDRKQLDVEIDKITKCQMKNFPTLCEDTTPHDVLKELETCVNKEPVPKKRKTKTVVDKPVKLTTNDKNIVISNDNDDLIIKIKKDKNIKDITFKIEFLKK